MSFLRCLAVFSAAGALAACGSNSSGDDASSPDAHTGSPDGHTGGPDATPGPDAMPGAYSCAGQQFPTTAPNTVTVSGTTESIGTGGTAALGSVVVNAYNASNTMVAGTTSDGTSGAYTLSLSTGGQPLAGYVVGTHGNYLTSYVYPPAPLATDLPNTPVLMIGTGTWGLLPLLAGANQDGSNPPTQGFIGVEVVDCTGMTVSGATVTSSSGDVHYTRNNLPVNTTGNGSATTTDTNGIALVFGVTPGDVTVGGSANGVTYVSHAIHVRAVDANNAQAVTETVIAPGPISGLAP